MQYIDPVRNGIKRIYLMNTTLSIAFLAGLISFLSPCVLPLVPGYISFVSGRSLNELLQSKKIHLLPLVLFSFGFSFVATMSSELTFTSSTANFIAKPQR